MSNGVVVEENRLFTTGRGQGPEDYGLRMEPDELERLVLNQHKRFHEARRSRVVRELKSTTRRHVKAVRSAERLLKRSELLEWWDSMEFDHDIFSLRELLEFSYPALQNLGYGRAVSASRSKIESLRASLERLS